MQGVGAIGRGKDRADVGRRLSLQFLVRHVGLSVLLQMELTALPGDATKHRAPRRLQSLMRIADNQLDAGQAALHQTLEELPPMRFVLAHRHRDAQNSALTVVTNTHSDQDRRVTRLPINAHLLVARIQQQIAAARQRTGAPLFQRGIQLDRRATNLGRGQCDTAQLRGDRRRLARRDALHIPFGQRQGERAFAVQPLRRRLGREAAVARLRRVKRHLADARGDRLGFAAIGIAAPCGGTFVQFGVEILAAFGLHGMVQHDVVALPCAFKVLTVYYACQNVSVTTIKVSNSRVTNRRVTTKRLSMNGSLSEEERKVLLGATVRRFREQRGLSLNHVAYDLLDLNGAGPLIAIEQGRRMPQLRTLRKLMSVLKLTPAEIAELEGLAGYRQETRLPPLDQILLVLEQLEPELARHAYPAYVIDYKFRYWMVNSAAAVLVGGIDKLLRLAQSAPTVFDVIFDSRNGLKSVLREIERLQIEQIYRFKLYNQFRRFEDFYRNLVDNMRNRGWPQEDFVNFRLLWERTDVLNDIAQQFEIYSVTPRVSVNIGQNVLRFYLFTGDLPWFERMLYVVMYHPESDADAHNAQQLTYSLPKECLRLWEIAPEDYTEEHQDPDDE